MVSRLNTCSTHGGLGYCSLADCWTPALKKDGNCTKHTKKVEESKKIHLIIVNYSPKTRREHERELCVHVYTNVCTCKYTVNILEEKKTFSHKNIISR